MSGDYIGTHDFTNATVLGVSSTPAKAKIYMSADQQILTTSATKLNLNTTSYDVGSNFDSVNNKYIIPTDGQYLFAVKIYLSSFTKERMIISIYVNGVAANQYWNSDSDLNVGYTTTLELTANDYVEIYVMSQTDTNYYIGGGTGIYKTELSIIEL